MSLISENFRLYWAVVTEKTFKYLSAGILSDKSTFSLDIVNFE